VEAVEDGPGRALLVGANFGARARIQLGPLTPDDVVVELYLGRLNPAGEILEAGLTPMRTTGRDAQGRYLFEATSVPCSKSGLHGFTIRVRPHHPDLPGAEGGTPFLPGLIAWA
jgi:starch phosphorylase